MLSTYSSHWCQRGSNKRGPVVLISCTKEFQGKIYSQSPKITFREHLCPFPLRFVLDSVSPSTSTTSVSFSPYLVDWMHPCNSIPTSWLSCPVALNRPSWAVNIKSNLHFGSALHGPLPPQRMPLSCAYFGPYPSPPPSAHSIESAAASGEIPCFVVTSNVFPMLLHCKTDEDRRAVSERKGGWKGWGLPAPLGDSWSGGVGWRGRASRRASCCSGSFLQQNQKGCTGNGMEHRTAPPLCRQHRGQEPSRANPDPEQWGGGIGVGWPIHSAQPWEGEGWGGAGSPSPASRHSNKTRPWSCRDTVKTKPRCTKSGHSWRCKNKTLLL